METVRILVETIWNILLLVPRALLALFPLYNTLASFKQDLIAAALGVSPVVIYLLFKILTAIKNYIGAR